MTSRNSWRRPFWKQSSFRYVNIWFIGSFWGFMVWRGPLKRKSFVSSWCWPNFMTLCDRSSRFNSRRRISCTNLCLLLPTNKKISTSLRKFPSPHPSHHKTSHTRLIQNNMLYRRVGGPKANSRRKGVKSTKNERYRGVSEAVSTCSRSNHILVHRPFDSPSSKTSIA